MKHTSRPGIEDTLSVPVAVPYAGFRPAPTRAPAATADGPVGMPAHPADEPGTGIGDWWVLADGAPVSPVHPLPSPRRLLLHMGLAVLAVFALVMVGSSFAASRLAEREAVNDAAHTTNLLAVSLVQPALSDALLAGEPTAYASLDRVVRENVLPNGIVRVKLWSPDGTVVYADERRLVGQRFALGEEQKDTLARPQTRAEVSDLDRLENEFERYGGKLLEVYRPVWTPSGQELLFEVYGDYGPVQARAFDLWRGLAGVLASSLLLLLVLLAPIIWRLLERLQTAQRHREALLRRAVEASDGERRRIAADLHDGPVQDLVASSLAVSGAAEAARSGGHGALARTISEAGSTVRSSVASLRSLLVEIYPARLADSGLEAALSDLARPLVGRGVDVLVDVDVRAAELLDPLMQQVVHRVVRECLRNVVKHAGASRVQIRLSVVETPGPAGARHDGGADGDPGDVAHPVSLAVDDDGVGFDPGSLSDRPGHFGVRVLADLASDVGGVLRVSSAPGRGTRWRLALPAETVR